MKKLLSLALALAMLLSLSVPVFATSAPETLYVDVGSVKPSMFTVSGVYIDVNDSGMDSMEHVSGTIYSYDTSSIDELTEIQVMISYVENSGTPTYTITTFEEGKNLLTLTGADAGTWSTYAPAPATPAGPSVTNGDKNVTGKYQAGAVSGIIYKVDITWGSMAFIYTAASKGTWNAGSHTYDGAKAAAWSWTDGDNEIKVTNHSNDGITVTPTYTADTGFEDASMTFDSAALSLGSADNGENGTGEPTTGTITVTPCGSVPAGTGGKIGQITLAITGANSGSTGTDTPSTDKATITGVAVRVGDTTYGSGETAIINKDSGTVTIIVTGTSLQNRTEDNCVKCVRVLPMSYTGWTVDAAGTEATKDYEPYEFELALGGAEIQYSNDGGTTYTDSGVTIEYTMSADELATINSVELVVSGKTYTSGDTVTLTPDSGTIMVRLSGTNFAKLSDQRNMIVLAMNTAENNGLVAIVDSTGWTVDTENNTATKTYESTEFSMINSADGFEILYSNDGHTTVQSGVIVKYSAD